MMSIKSSQWLKIAFLAVLVGILFECYAGRLIGFDIGDDALIPPGEIYPGGPDKDGIPALDKPRFSRIGAADEPAADARILGLEMDGVAKAYPIAILNWHEIVNDHFGDQAVAVTFCPLCGSGVAFTAEADGEELSFGVSGLLYNSDVLLYDRQTDSLWSQILSKAVTGPMRGKRLEKLPLAHTSWGDWKGRHPDSLFLSRKTGYSRDYDSDPYAGYENEVGVYFPVKHKSGRYHPKERVMGLEVDGRFRAYPFAELSRSAAQISEVFAGREVTIHYDADQRSAQVTDEKGAVIPTVTSFWFAWYAFHPDTEVYTASE